MSFKQKIVNTLKLPFDAFVANFGQHKIFLDEPRLWIIMYHRILPENDHRYSLEEPGMLVQPDTFHMHLRELKKTFTIIPLVDWVNRKNQGFPLPEKACAITFDDGWLDNYEFAFPILKQEEVSATIFAVSHMIGKNEEFWPNRITRLMQQPKKLRQQIPWLSSLTSKGEITQEVLAQAIYSLKNMEEIKLLEHINNAEIELGLHPIAEASLMNWQQLRELSDSGLVDIGSHTSSHIRLTENIPSNIYQKEIIESKKKLESELDKPVELFCYPNGDYSTKIVNEVAKHYLAAVTTQRGVNYSNSTNLLELSRYGIHQDISNTRHKLFARLGR